MDLADALKQIDVTFEALLRRLDDVEHDQLDVESGDGKIVLAFDDGAQLIISRQSGNGQIWLAEPGGGWHFDYNGRLWICDKRGLELIQTLEDLMTSKLGEPVDLR